MLPSLPGIQDHCPVLLGIFVASRCPPPESSVHQDIYIAVYTSAGPILYQPVPKCKKNTCKKTLFLCCVSFREQLWNFRSSRGHIWTESVFQKSFLCVCVCDTRTFCRATQTCLFFREQSCPRALCFEEHSDIYCALESVRFSTFLHCFALY